MYNVIAKIHVHGVYILVFPLQSQFFIQVQQNISQDKTVAM